MNGQQMEQKRHLKVAIIGGGLVGSLSACFFAKRGHDVKLYEYRQDIRKVEKVTGRSINLAMSERARAALREIGLEEKMIQHGIPMKGRMIHKLDGEKNPILYDAVHNQCIYSVGRKHLNEYLLTAAEQHSNVETIFQHKLLSVNPEEGLMTFLRMQSNDTATASADLIIGADGAYSTVRKEVVKHPLHNYSQQYIEHGYMELCIPSRNNDFAAEPNYLHIWPRGSFMMIALPNQDKSFTVTLFMPFSQFSAINSKHKLLHFFRRNFPDAVPLIGEEDLVSDFFASQPSHLISIKCNPYHVGNKVLLIGDAAHAMVPFFGQGMNAGFEDCLLLDQLMTKFHDNLTFVLPEFSELRNPDAEAVCDLAMYNYFEMRDLVNRKTFLLRKKLDNILYSIFSNSWIPLYNSVTFTNIKYTDCVRNKKFQDKVVSSGLAIFAAAILSILLLQVFDYS